jgi:folate-dependent tRNA-U54 methylase TrmFO/GidA
VDRGNRDVGSSDVNNKGGGLAGSETAHELGQQMVDMLW